MTSANLSVGLKTSAALEALRAFKDQAKAEMRGFKIEAQIDFKGSVEEAMKKNPKLSVEVLINSEVITKTVRDAVHAGLRETFEVRINTGGLTQQVRDAVNAGMVGTVKPGVAAPAAPGIVASPALDMKAVTTQVGVAVADAVANQVGKAIQKSNLQQQAGAKGSIGFSATDPSTGMRIGVREQVEPDLALPQTLALIERKRQEDAAKVGLREEAEARAARARRQKEEDAAYAAYYQDTRKNKDAAFDLADRETRKKLSQDETNALKQIIRDRRQAEKDGLTSAQNFFAAERKIQDEILALEKDKKGSFTQGRTFATEQRQSVADARRADRARSGAFDSLEADAEKARKQEMDKAWAFQEAQRAAAAKKTADMERLAQVAANSRKQQLDKEVADFKAAEAEKEAAQAAAARRSKSLLADAQRVANDTWQSIKNLRRSQETDDTKNVRFANPGQTNEIRRLEGQLKTLAEAEALVGKSGTGLAIRKYGTDAVAAIPQIEALKQKLIELRAVANAAGSGDQGPSPAALLRQQMRNVRATAEAEARASQRYTPTGVKVAGAEALADQFGQKAAAAFINNDALMRQIGQLDSHRKQVDNNSAAYKRWRESMNDVHSASRGLAGSLGMLWVTWGATAPIVAAAALGGAMRSVFVVGKDLEYQLQFVSVLSDNTAVSLTRFGDAVRGTMVAPVEAAQALRGLAQNGLSVREAMQALPAILNLATAGEMALSEAALGATGVMAAFNLQVSDLGRISDVFAKAAALSNTSVTGMVEAMRQASTVSDQYNVSLEETAATLAVMAKRNIAGSAAGTAFRNMMVELTTPHEKAKRAMEAVGLQLYDNSNQLKDYGSVLEQLRDKVVTLNEKGKLTFLNEMFGERGAKAANALLSDFDLYKETLRKLQDESQNFSSNVARALQETTQGKLKALVTEFQLATSATFNGANKDINYFIDTLRNAAASVEFQNMLTSVAKAVTSLTTFLVENGNQVVTTIGLWMGFRAISGLVSGVVAFTGALTAAGVAANGLRIAMSGVAMAATGGIGLIAALAAQYFVFKSNTNESTEAQKQLNTQLDIVAGNLQRETQALTDSNRVLFRRIQLMREGKTYAQSGSIVDEEAAKNKGLDLAAQTKKAEEDLAKAQAIVTRYEEWKKNRDTVFSPVKEEDYLKAKGTKGRFGSKGVPGDIEVLTQTLQTAREIEANFNTGRRERVMQMAGEEDIRRRRELEQFRKDVNDASKSSKGKIKGEDLIPDLNRSLIQTREEFDDALAEQKRKFNERKGTFSPADPKKAAEARADAKSEASLMIKEMERERQDLENSIKNRRKIDNSIFDEKSLGAETSALMENNRAREESIKLAALDAQWREVFKAALKNPNLNDRDRSEYESALERLRAKSERTREDLETDAAVAANTAIRKAKESATVQMNLLEELRTKSRGVSDDIRRSTEKKYIDPETAVRRNAEAKIDDVFQNDIINANKEVAAVKARIADLQDRVNKAAGEDLKKAQGALAIQREVLELKEREAGILVEERDRQKGKVGSEAVDSYKRSLTAEAGFERFWGEYREMGANSADFVYQAMKTSTDNMGRAFEQFGATGKISSRSLINSIMADLGRLAAQSVWRQLLGMVFSSIGGTPTVPTSLGEIGFGMTSIAFAKGGVMTPYGPLPLRKYEAGGVARSAQVAIHGEGRKPEAYVPLEDGRTIPVTVDSPTSGGGSVIVEFNPTTNIDSRSDAGQIQMMMDRQIRTYHEQLSQVLRERGVNI